MRGIFEPIIVFAVMTGLLLPSRILFVEYVSDDWFGSLGIISVIFAAVVFLSRRQKLGFFGSMFERQMYKFQKGKRGLIVFGESATLLLLLGSMIFAIEQGNSTYSHLKIPTPETVTSADPAKEIDNATFTESNNDWFMGLLMTPVMFLTHFPQMSAIIASIDEDLDGWLLHFYTVGFIEYLELVGVLIFYKFSSMRKSKTIHSLTAKCPVR